MSTAAVVGGPNVARSLRAPRRLGSELAPPRILYLLYLPLFMMATGLLCWVVPNDTMLMVGSSILGLVSAYIFFAILVLQAPLRISTLLMTSLGLGYGLGAANSWFTIPRHGATLAEFLHRDGTQLTHTMGSVLFAMSILLAVGEYAEKPLFGEDFELQIPQQAILFITVGVALIIVAYARGSLNYMGASHSETGQLSIFTAFAVWLIGTLFAISLVATLNARGKGTRRYLMLLTAIQFMLEIPIGRRSLIYTIVLAMIALRLGRFRFNWSWTKKIIFGVLLAGMLYVATIGFFYLRLAGFSTHGKLGILDRISLAITYFETKDYAEVQKSFSENVQTRTFILGFLAQVEDLSAHFTPGYGRDLQQQSVAAIPSILYPNKNRNTNEEGMANELFGTSFWDEANSVLTAGAIDFGLLGIVFYPLMVSFLLRGLLELAGEALPTFVATFIIVATLGRVLEAENTMTDYITIIRNGALFGSVVWFFLALPAFRLRQPN